MPKLNVTYSPLQQSTGDESLSSVNFIAVRFPDVFGFLGNIEGIAGFHLHSVGQFVGLNASIEPVVEAGRFMPGVPFRQKVELPSLISFAQLRMIDVFYELANLLFP